MAPKKAPPKLSANNTYSHQRQEISPPDAGLEFQTSDGDTDASIDLQPLEQRVPEIYFSDNLNSFKPFQIKVSTVITIEPKDDRKGKGKKRFAEASSSKTIESPRPKRGRPPANPDKKA